MLVSNLARLRRALLTSTILGLLPAGQALAQNATWTGAVSNAFGDASNWSPVGAPSGTAFFDSFGRTVIDINSNQTVSGFTFNLHASSYGIFNYSNLAFTGSGIVNNSDQLQTLYNQGGVYFQNASTAGATIVNGGGLLMSSLLFRDTSTAGTATINNNTNGSILFENNSTAGAATIKNNKDGTVSFIDSSTAGNATIRNNPGGRVQFAFDSTAGNATIDNSGIIYFFNTSTGGNATIRNNAGAYLEFASSSTAGNATIENSGDMRFWLNASASNARLITNAGGTTDFDGKSDDSAGSIAGAGNYVLRLSSLTVGGNGDTTTVSGTISGVGALIKTGAGTLTLSGANTYTGATTVNAGRLDVNGSIASPMTTVNAGGTLGGNGTVGNTTINGGALAPGNSNSIGTLTVQGNLVLTAASTYMVEVDPNGAGRTNVTGTAALGGATVRATFASGSYVSRQYTILNASGGRNGTFTSLANTNLPANFTSQLSYDANNAYLNVTLNSAAVGNGLTFNQTNVANALVNSFNAAGGIPLAFGALTPQGLTQVSGETATGSQQVTFNVMSQFLNAMLDPNAVGRGGNVGQGGVSSYADEALAYASTGKGRTASERDAYAAMARKAPPRVADAFNRWSVWATGYGGSQTTTGNATVGSADTTARIYGAAAGADYRFSPDTFVGFALGGAGTNYGLANGLGKGSSDVFQAGVYGRHDIGAAYVAAALAYGWQDVTTDRTVLGVDRLRARFDANALSGRIESGYRFAALGMGVTPYAAGQFTTFFLPGYAEQVVAGSNLFALTYQSKDVTASRSELGVRTDKSFALNDALLTLRGRAAWAHNFNTDRSIQAAFLTLPASGFIVNGAAQARDAALVSAGAEMAWRNGVALAGTFEGEFSRNVESYAGKGSVRYRW